MARCSLAAKPTPIPRFGIISNIARAQAALGTGGLEEVKALLLQVAQDWWLCRCQHPVVRYHGAGVTSWVSQRTRDLTGGAQRCGRALAKLKTRAVVGVDTALAQVQTILRTVKNTTSLPRANRPSARC